MSISKTVEFYGRTLTAGDLREFLDNINSAPDDHVISVDKAPVNNHPTDPGGEITLRAEIPTD